MDYLLAGIFDYLSESDINNMSHLLSTIMANSRNRIFEAGLLDLYHKQINARISLHDMLDLFVISGIMSPCPARSLNTGLAWYEINPVCYWLKPSM
jgi:geranylgeranyl pyrophosphate synthase